MKNDLTAKASVIIKAPPSKVWAALTEPRIIKQYFFGTNTVTDWKVGGPIQFRGQYEGKPYEDKGTVLAFEPEELIRYTYWSSMSGIEDRPENYVTITYRLFEEDNKVHVEISQENVPDEETKQHSEDNWRKVLSGLKSLLEESTEVNAF